MALGRNGAAWANFPWNEIEPMEKLSVKAILDKIKNRKTFEAVAEDYSFTLKIEKYTHYICGAIHDGHQFRRELWDYCLHTEYERWFEEDPATKTMIAGQPIVIAGMDSRFEYDLNRSIDNAIYTDAWGKQLWKDPLSQSMVNTSLTKHNNFYRVTHALVEAIEDTHGACLVYDMHSYNWMRWNRDTPTWNLGTSNIDNHRFGDFIEDWRTLLAGFSLPNDIESSAKINDIFQGNGFFLKYITQHFKDTLVMATEIKKIYCDELNQVMFPEVIVAITENLSNAIAKNSDRFKKGFID